MFFKRFYDDNLAQASYMIACDKTREAIIIDPNLDVAQYIAPRSPASPDNPVPNARHADFARGICAGRSHRAALHLSAEGATEGGIYSDAMKARTLRGARVMLAKSPPRRSHPGHTRALSFFVSDLERGEDPVGALTGDFVFVGDVGRPDLLERAAGATGSTAGAAAELFRSVRNFSAQPDYLQIWPGHGAGSACGKSLGAMPQSTIGYEKLFNGRSRK